MKPVIRGGAIIASTIFLSSLIFSAQPSVAETSAGVSQQGAQVSQDPKNLVAENASNASAAVAEVKPATVEKEEEFVAPPVAYVATAYSLHGRTASGANVNKGIIAADPRFLPLGSRVRLNAGGYSGEYLVADTGGAIRGRRIDIWTPTSREALRFGRRTVKLTVLSYGGRRKATKHFTDR
jgi:3D (Asp-Asp-Asp) domain-containing protein